MKRVLPALVLAPLALLVSTPPAEAASPVLIGRTQYNSPGSDTRTNSSLNAEWMVIKNTTTVTRSLRGWTVRDVANHVYTFGAVSLKPGASLTLHTGKGTNTASHLYWGSGNYIWNNDGDTAYLKNASGTTVDSCRWTASSGGVTNC